MSIKATVRVGKGCNISLEASNPVELIKAASQFSQLPSQCGHCKSENLGFMHRQTGDKGQYDYLHIKCQDCGAQADLGQSETIKGNVFFKHQPKDKTNVQGGFYRYWEQAGAQTKDSTPASRNASQQSSQQYDSSDEEDVPF